MKRDLKRLRENDERVNENKQEKRERVKKQ